MGPRPLRCVAGLAIVLLTLMPIASATEKQVSQLDARHQAGQTLLTFREAEPLITADTVAATRIRDLRRESDKTDRVRYRVYRSTRPIESLAELTPVAEVPPLTGWNIDYFGDLRPDHQALRYVVEDGGPPVSPTTAICVIHPAEAGDAYYAVTVVLDGQETTRLTAANTLAEPVRETVGLGVPVLQRVEQPEQFNYVRNPTLYYFVRWEAPPHTARPGLPIDYVVAVPEQVTWPAPVGIHLHCWGGSLNGGYGWWYQAEQGHLLLASNQVPYDWWTGYHERYWDGRPDKAIWEQGVVRPYSQRRLLSFLDWMATRWDIDRTRTHVAGSSMGGSGALMFAIRHAERIAWAAGWVGVHVPRQSPTFRSSYANVYGPPEWEVKFEDGTPVWDYFDDTWYLRRYPQAEIGLIAFSNGKNDGGIGWRQAVEFHRALQETRRPHVFVWGQQGHGQRAVLPVSLSDRYLPLDLRTDQSLPAFTQCDLDDDPGDGDPQSGEPQGQSNQYLCWETAEIVDTAERWEMTVGLIDRAPQDSCTVHLTPRRVQQFRPAPGTQVRWTNRSLAVSEVVDRGTAEVDSLGLITLPGLTVDKGLRRISITR
jgi:pimeloyl-ACP methyl ester carboxylesterase